MKKISKQMWPLIAVAAATIVFYLLMYFLKRIPLVDTLQASQLNHDFINEIVRYQDFQKWLPFHTHGLVASICTLLAFSFLTPFQIFFSFIFPSIPTIFWFYLGIATNEIILASGVYLCSSFITKSRLIKFFIVSSSVFAIVSTEQMYIGLNVLTLIPLLFYFCVKSVQQNSIVNFSKAIFVFSMTQIGTSPYYVGIYIMLFGLFLALTAVFIGGFSIKQFLRNARQHKGWSAFLIVLSFLNLGVFFISYKYGLEVDFLFQGTRDAQAHVPLQHFLAYCGLTDPLKYHELFNGLSYNGQHQIFSGFLTAFCVVVLLMFPFRYIFSKKIDTIRFAHILLFICVFIGLFSSATFLANIMYYTVPMMKFFRHIGFQAGINRIFLPLLAGYLLSQFLNPKAKPIPKLSVFILNIGRIVGIFYLLKEIRHLFKHKTSYFYQRVFLENNLVTFDSYRSAPHILHIIIVFLSLIGFIWISRHFMKAIRDVNVLSRLNHLKKAVIVNSVFLILYKFTFSWISSAQATPEMWKAYEIRDLEYQSARSEYYPENERFRAYRGLLYYPDDSPDFEVAKNSFKFPGSRVLGTLGPLYPSADTFFGFDSCVPISLNYVVILNSNVANLFKKSKLCGVTCEIKQDSTLSKNISETMGCYSPKIRILSQVLTTSPEVESNEILTNPELIKILDIDKSKFTEKTPRTARSIRETAIHVIDFQSNKLKVKLTNPVQENIFFVYADAFHSFWKANVDGRQVPILKADLAYKAVRATTNSTIEFRFENRLLDFGYICLFISIFILMGLTVAELRKEII